MRINRSPRRAVLVAAFGFASVIAVFAPAGTANASSGAGPARIINRQGSPITGGGSATVFGLQLPVGAACPGDTMHQHWLVSSFAVPTTVDPAGVSFPENYPSSGVDLITTDGEPFITQATEPVTGAIVTLPPFSWSRYDHDQSDLPLGEYTLGVGCYRGHEQITRYWAARVKFSPSAADPGGFTWTVLNPGSNAGSGVGPAIAVGVGIAAVGIAGLIGITGRWKRRSGSRPDPGSGSSDNRSPSVHLTARQS